TSAYSGTVSPLYSLVPAGMFGHEDVFKTVYGASPNIGQAQTLLTQAGYSSSNKLSLTLWYTPSHYGDPEIFVAQALKRAWQTTQQVVFKPTVSGIVLDPIQFFRYFTISVSRVRIRKPQPFFLFSLSPTVRGGEPIGGIVRFAPGLCDHPGDLDGPHALDSPDVHLSPP